MFPLDDTIAAIASPSGGAARGIVRISGPRAFESLAGVFRDRRSGVSPLLAPRESLTNAESSGETPLLRGSEHLPPPDSPRVVTGSLHIAELHSPIPCEVYLWCGRPACSNAKAGETPAPQVQVRSYTGQPVAEIHTIGSPPLLQIVLRALCTAGCRLAGPGEFTLRAFLAGRIDLTQAEAVLGVIDADDGHALATALGQLAGGLARPLHRLRDDLLELLAHIEAGLDFADEDLPFVTREELDRRLGEAEEQVAAVQRQLHSRAEPVDVVRAVLVGRPNTGKSSLFNALVGNASALVSHHPGTTRDYLTADLDLDGVKCRLIDTAGTGSEPLAVSHDGNEIEHAAQLAAETQRRSADVQVLCLDSSRPLDDWERDELLDSTIGERGIAVLTKCDAASGIDIAATGIETSSLTGVGIETLRNELRRKTLAAAGLQGDVVAGTAIRCRESLRLAGLSLQQAQDAAKTGQEELVAAEIRVALDDLGKVVGAVYTDDLLDRIFSRFCIGK
jgi:tRNA modification GTPase